MITACVSLGVPRAFITWTRCGSRVAMARYAWRTRPKKARLSCSKRFSSLSEPLSDRSEEHTSELQSLRHLVCRLLLDKKEKRRGAFARGFAGKLGNADRPGEAFGRPAPLHHAF